jgi:putative acyl-CoA dehydrogenase
LRLARTFEADAGDDERALARVATPALKYWLCKRTAAVVAEAMEVLGGNGYVEESALSRMYREAPLNSIWEGSGNVMCLDVLRATRREPAVVEALQAELALARGGNALLDAHVGALTAALADTAAGESGARRLAGGVAVALAAALVVRHAAPTVADAYCASRLDRFGSGAVGTLPSGIGCAEIIAQASE